MKRTESCQRLAAWLTLAALAVSNLAGCSKPSNDAERPEDEQAAVRVKESFEPPDEAAHAKTQRPRGKAQIVFFPAEIQDSAWIEKRKKAQLKTVGDFRVFHDFRFHDRLEESGIRFVHRIVDDVGKHYKPVHYDHGNGVAVADVDGDGLLDIYFSTQLGPNQLWRNSGAGRFEDITQSAGVALEDRVGVTASFADIDNDADPDLYVTTVRGGNAMFENDGNGKFTDISKRSGLDYRGHSSGVVFFDYNRDGLLDLFLTNVGTYTTEKKGRGGYYVGVLDGFAGHLKPERSERSILFRNEGRNRFVDVSREVDLLDASWSGDASPLDINEDGWLDLYVLNMQGHDEYYQNVEGRKFVKKSREVFPKTPWGSMGIKVFDFNNDGHMDIYITDMHSDMSEDIPPEWETLKSRMSWPESLLKSGGMSIFGNAFYRNRGNGTFDEISDKISAENYWPWGLSVGDLNADGYEDVFLASSMNYPFRYGVNSALLNDRGEKFLDSEFILGVEPRRNGTTVGPAFQLDCSGEDSGHRLCRDRQGSVEVWGALGSRSSAIFDLDGDGDLDIVTNELNSRPMVLVSNLTEKKKIRFLKVKLTGTKSNRSGLGAVVKLRAGSATYTKVHDGQSGYLSQSLYPLYFGLGDAAMIDQIEVRWPSGKNQVVPGPLASNTVLEVREP